MERGCITSLKCHLELNVRSGCGRFFISSNKVILSLCIKILNNF